MTYSRTLPSLTKKKEPIGSPAPSIHGPTRRQPNAPAKMDRPSGGPQRYQRATTTTLLTFLVLLHVLAVGGEVATVTRLALPTASREDSSPTGLTKYEVQINRVGNCSANVTERFYFNSLKDNKVQLREIATLPFQNVTKVTAKQDDKEITVKLKTLSKRLTSVEMATKSTDKDTMVELRYSHDAFVMWSRNLFVMVGNRGWDNVMRWRSGQLGTTVPLVSVRFSAEINRSVQIEGNETDAKQRNASFNFTDRIDPVQIYARERGGPRCTRSLAFFDDGGTPWGTIFIPIACFFALVIYIVCVGGTCGGRPGAPAAPTPRARTTPQAEGEDDDTTVVVNPTQSGEAFRRTSRDEERIAFQQPE